MSDSTGLGDSKEMSEIEGTGVTAELEVRTLGVGASRGLGSRSCSILEKNLINFRNFESPSKAGANNKFTTGRI